jgi:hypothetical protein
MTARPRLSPDPPVAGFLILGPHAARWFIMRWEGNGWYKVGKWLVVGWGHRPIFLKHM